MEEEIIIDVPEEVIVEESENVVPVEPDPQESEQTENDLLIEYIKNELLKNESEEIDQLEQTENLEMQSELNTVNEVVAADYSQQLDDIQDELSSISVYMENDVLNNQMDSSVNDISLTNTLIIVTIICILFTATLNFARRIF